MNIYIKYDLDKSIFNTKSYQSIKSIINEYLHLNSIYDNIENYFIDYNGLCLNNDYSLEKYDIENNAVITLNKKIKGGSLKNRILIIVFGVIIGIIPIFVLPLGFIPLTAGLIKVIIEKSINTIFKYLVCTLGKVTLYSRLNVLLFCIKYFIFILMIYVTITFPLIIFCISLKGHTILDNPTSMCKAISVGSTTGLILTCIFLMIYSCFKFGDYILKFFINIFKLTYITNTIINPILQTLMQIYDKLKYLPIKFIPVLGEGLSAYFIVLNLLLNIVNVILSSIQKLGCKLQFNKQDFLKNVMSGVKSLKKKKHGSSVHGSSVHASSEDGSSDNNSSKQSNIFGVNNIMCEPDLNQCCAAENYEFIGDSLSSLLDNDVTSDIIKSYKIYPSFVLVVEALYGAGLDRLGYNTGLYGPLYEQKNYLNRILESNSEKLKDITKDLIYTFLTNGDQQLIPKIKNALDTNLNIPIDQSKIDEVNKLKTKIDNLEERMIHYSNKENAAYVVGGSLFKTIFKFIFVNIFCNVVTTAKTSEDVISKMGDLYEMIDMLKAGSSSGLFVSIIYIITVIVIVICSIFNVF